MKIWIKICGNTCIEDARAAVEAGADALGFIFAPSKRQVSAEQVQEIVVELPETVERIGVFSDDLPARVADVVAQTGLTGVQLHGEETPAFISEFKSRLAPARNVSVIKTVLVNGLFDERFAHVCRNYDRIDSILLDSGGGSGRTFDWQKAQPLLQSNKKHLIVAGGLNPRNVGEAIKKFTPWGVDVVSGVECEPGRKDPEKLRAFIAAVRRAEKS